MLAIVASLSSGALLMAATNAAHAEDNNKVEFHLKGWVAAKCTVNGGQTVTTPVTVGNVNVSASTFTEYPINCNAPFRYTISSMNGGLQRTSEINGSTPKRLYNVNVNIPTDLGAINDNCASNTIRNNTITCPINDSGDGVALDQKAKLTVSWQATPAVPAGTYSDKLTFTVGLKH